MYRKTGTNEKTKKRIAFDVVEGSVWNGLRATEWVLFLFASEVSALADDEWNCLKDGNSLQCIKLRVMKKAKQPEFFSIAVALA